MIHKKPPKALFFLIVFLVFVGFFARPLNAELSITQEKELGDKFLKAALRHLRLIEDPDLVDYVTGVGKRIVKHLEVHTFPYDFYIVNSDALNAFAAPAGHVFINRGLIEIMDDEGELAAILAHEIAHVQSRHISQRMARAKKLNLASIGAMLAGIFVGGEAGQALIAGSQAGSASTQLNYSRQDEEEADRKGLLYLEAAGYRGQDMVNIMRKMGEESWLAGGRIPTYLSTHPGVRERVNYLASVVETRRDSLPTAREEKLKLFEFKMIQAKLRGDYQDASEAETSFQQLIEKPETRVMGYYGMGVVQRRQGKMEEAVNSFKLAISQRPDLSPLLVELGETYFRMGKLDKAASVLESALSLEPNQPAALYALGRCLLERGDAAGALANLREAAHLNDRLTSINYYLGMAYGRLNQLGEAHYHFGLHYEREGSWRNARFHFQEALRYTDRPERKVAIQKALKELEQQSRASEGNNKG